MLARRARTSPSDETRPASAARSETTSCPRWRRISISSSESSAGCRPFAMAPARSIVSYSNNGIRLLLVGHDGQDFFDSGNALGHLAQPRLAERDEARVARLLLNAVVRLLGEDHPAEVRADAQELEQRDAAREAGIPTAFAPAAAIEHLGTAHLGQHHAVVGTCGVRLFARRANLADESLRGRQIERRRDEERFDSEIDEPRERRRRIVR